MSGYVCKIEETVDEAELHGMHMRLSVMRSVQSSGSSEHLFVIAI